MMTKQLPLLNRLDYILLIESIYSELCKSRPTEISITSAITSAIIILVESLVPAVVLHHPSVDGQEPEDDPSTRHLQLFG